MNKEGTVAQGSEGASTAEGGIAPESGAGKSATPAPSIDGLRAKVSEIIAKENVVEEEPNPTEVTGDKHSELGKEGKGAEGKEGEPTAPGKTEEVDPKAAAATYTPSLKYKVLNKEKEFPAFLKDVIKDEATEKQVRELFEKAEGLDIVKPKYVELKQAHQDLQQNYQGLVGSIEDLRTCYQRGDFDSFFDRLKIPFNTLLQYVAEKVQYQELPPEQRAQIDRQKQAERASWAAENTALTREQQTMEQMVQVRGQMLDLALERADVKTFATAFEEKFGRSFREAVIDYGISANATRQIDLMPEQAIKEMMDWYGKALTPATQAAAAAPAATTQTTQAQQAPQATRQPPVIPNVSGRQTSPTGGNKPKSIEDLRKIRAEKLAHTQV